MISMWMAFSLLACHAQGMRRGNIELAAGPSFPLGDFSYDISSHEGSGYANRGFSLDLSFQYRLKDHLGLLAAISGYVSPVNEYGLANKYWQPGFDWSWTIDAEPWISNAYMGGIDIVIPIYSSDFYFRLLGGCAYTRLPELRGSSSNFLREASTDLAAAFRVGSGIKYQNFEKVTLSLELDVFVTNPVLEESWSADAQTPTSSKIYQNMVIVNLKAGLGLRLFR
jgi:hypothetical protein